MNFNFLKRIITNNGRLSIENKEYRRAILLNSTFLIMFAIFGTFLILNLFVYNEQMSFFINLTSFMFNLGAFIYFHRTDDIEKSSVLSVIIILSTLFCYLMIEGQYDYGFYWISVIPAVLYNLLGVKKANIIIVFYFTYFLLFIMTTFKNWKSDFFGVPSIANIAIATLAIIFLKLHGEKVREEMTKAMEEKNMELKIISTTDKLTGIYNRTKLDDILCYELNRISRINGTMSIVLADIDNFKRINDTYGHLEGDIVIKNIAEIIKNTCRNIDIVGRWGGEEFLIICPDTDENGVLTLAKRILENVNDAENILYEKITISIGFTTLQHEDNINSILKRADDALYLAKLNGKSRIEVL